MQNLVMTPSYKEQNGSFFYVINILFLSVSFLKDYSDILVLGIWVTESSKIEYALYISK